MPRASVMPPAAITGTLTASATCGTSANAGLSGDVVAKEYAAMAAGLVALRDDGVDAALLEPTCFGRGRGRAHHLEACLDAFQKLRFRQPEVEAHDIGLRSTTSHILASNAVRLLEGIGAAGSIPSSCNRARADRAILPRARC